MNEWDAHEHRELRELLGAYALGALEGAELSALGAHLDGCAGCRAELAEIAPLAADLRRLDPDVLSDLPVPPPGLGERIHASIALERGQVRTRAQRERRHRVTRTACRRFAAAAAAVVVLAAAGGVGTLVGRASVPQVTAQPPVPARLVEQVELRPLDPRLEVEEAKVIAHSWGVEATFKASGFPAGEVFRAAFRTAGNQVVPAGEFLGTGGDVLTCNMQSSLLRADASGFVVFDAAGNEVLSADL